ncbi:L,D-transpeptidase catalytic domain [Amycolatopsis tolypomycina]|uniref:L,D-transpeptidase catalytic domain n=1 Tax=Amycolatopsis tolypomycina TaxID=208445 RepID=A0A1H5DNK0_9PSEU|nr:L,D-transpeptidase catalytic domain [Amycolatopsis tolypomycina]
MRVRRVLAALSTLAAAAALTACSAGGTADVKLAAETPSAPASTTSAATPAPAPVKAKPVMAAGVPCTITAKACVSLSGKQAWLLDEGKIVYGPVKMLPGKKSDPTPVGKWRVEYKEKMHLSKEFDNAKMPNSVFFAPGGIAFHEGSLSRYSAGCVHLSSAASLKFFTTLEKGDEVQVVR